MLSLFGGDDLEKLTATVSDLSGEIKIRDYLTRLGFSTSLIAKVKAGGVFINGENVHMRAMVRNGDTVSITMPKEDSENIPPINIPLEILFEDERILVVNKPRNMPIHPSRGNSLPTLANAVRAYLDRPFVFRCITRLDRDTSGVVLIAKDRLSAAILSRAMKAGAIKKTYLARVVGIPTPSDGRISAPIERESEGGIKRVVREGGKPSVTEYKTLSADADSAILEVTPITGRTHQIRVHMSYIGHPLVDDFLYGERREGDTYRLHCARLEFPHPDDGRIVVATSENPDI